MRAKQSNPQHKLARTSVGGDVNIDPLECLTPDTLHAVAPTIKKQIDANGFCVLEPWDDSPDTLQRVASLLGDTQGHIRGGEDGIVGETESAFTSWKQHRDEYHGLSADEMPPHTDGAFLDGLAPADGGELERLGPPALVVLQCVRTTGDGGTSVLVDSQRIMEDLVRTDADLARVLLTPGCISFCRDDQLALDFPVYEHFADSCFRIRFRFDSVAYTPPWASSAVAELHRHYHLDPRYTVRVHLCPGQILIVDNYRVLHGREAFKRHAIHEEDRKLRRIWISSAANAVVANPRGTPSNQRALAVYAPYRRIPNPSPYRMRLRLGVRLSHEAMTLVSLMMTQICHRGALA